MASTSSITLMRIGISGMNVPNTSSGFLCYGPGYKVYSRTWPEAVITLVCELPQRNSYVIVPRLEGIKCELDETSGRTYRLRLTGPKVNQAVSRIAQAVDYNQVIAILAPFAAIVPQLRATVTRDRATPQQASASGVVIDELHVWGLKRPFATYGRTYEFAGVKVEISPDYGPSLKVHVKVPRGKRFVHPQNSDALHYSALPDGRFLGNGWSVDLNGPAVDKFFQDASRAESPQEVWGLTEYFRNHLLRNCRTE